MYEVGQKLFVQYMGNRRGTGELAITKVGRKWLALSGGLRASITSLAIDGGEYSCPGQCYVSREDWEREVLQRTSWDSLRMSIWDTRTPPKGVTPDVMNQAAVMLGLRPNTN